MQKCAGFLGRRNVVCHAFLFPYRVYFQRIPRGWHSFPPFLQVWHRKGQLRHHFQTKDSFLHGRNRFRAVGSEGLLSPVSASKGDSQLRESCFPQSICMRYSHAEMCCLGATWHVQLAWKKGLFNLWTHEELGTGCGSYFPCLTSCSMHSVPCSELGAKPLLVLHSSWMCPCPRHLISPSGMW